MRRQAQAGLVTLLLVGIVLAASCGGAVGQNATSSAGLRKADVPPGWTRCAWSGSLSRYLPLARKDAAESADSVQLSWTAQQKVGALRSAVTGYVGSPSDCSRGIGLTVGASALTWTIAYQSAQDAHRGYKTGVLGFPTPDQSRIQPGLEVGASTGLGPDSWTLTQTSPAPALFLAWWRHGWLTNFLVTVGLPSTDANPIALRVDARMAP